VPSYFFDLYAKGVISTILGRFKSKGKFSRYIRSTLLHLFEAPFVHAIGAEAFIVRFKFALSPNLSYF